jgi:hypothetical protein
MKSINLAIREKPDDEAKSFTVLMSELPNRYGLYTGKIVDDTLSEIFSVTKSSLSACETEIVNAVHSLGQIVNLHEIKKDEETEKLIKRIKNLGKENKNSL